MIENCLHDGNVPGFSEMTKFGSSPVIEQMSIAQGNPSDFFSMIASVELTQQQLLACLAVILFAVFVIAWYWRFIIYRVSRKFRRTVAWFRQLAGFGAPALGGGSDQVTYYWKPVAEQTLTPDEQPSQTMVVEPDDETVLDETTEFDNRDTREESEWHTESVSLEQSGALGTVSSVDLGASHQHLIEQLSDAERLESQLRSELEAAQQSLELKTAELAQLDEQLASVSGDLANKSDSVADLEAKNSDLQLLADSLQKKLDLADSELEKQSEQNVTLQSQIKVAKDESIELVEQASRAGLLDEQISALKQELADRSSDLTELKVTSTEAQKSASSNAKLFEQSQKHGQELAEQLTGSKEQEKQARTELERAQKSIESLTADLAQAEEEVAHQEEATERLVKENAELKSKSDSVADLEAKNSDLQLLADSLQKKLDLADSELEKQSEQNVTLQSQIKVAKDESIELVEQASRAGLLDEQISALKQELADRSSDLTELKVTSTEAQKSASSNAKLFEQSQKHGQELAEQLTGSKEQEKQARTELERAQKSIESLTADLAQAEEEVAHQEEATERLVKENAELKSKLEESTARLANVTAESKKATVESKKLTDSRMAVEAKLKSEQDLLRQTKDEFDSATLQIAELQEELSSTQAALTKNAHDQAKATQLLQAKLDDATSSAVQAESQHKDVCSQLESKLSQSADELTSLQDETKRLKSKLDSLSENTAEADALRKELASKTSELTALTATQTERETKLSETETRAAVFEKQAQNAQLELSETLELLDQEQSLATELKKQVNEKLAENAQLTARLTKHSELVASFESLGLRNKELDQNLVQTSTKLEQEQQLNARLREGIAERDDELSSQTAKHIELEEQAKILQQHAEEVERKLAASTKKHVQQTTLCSQLEETNQRLSADLDRQSSEYSNLEKQLVQASQASADNSIIESKFEQQQQELAELKMAFDKEGTQRAELLQVLDAKRAQIEELEKQVSTATENQQHIDKLLNKVRKYKFAHAKNKELLEQVVAKSKSNYTQGLGYLNLAKSLRSELNAQRKISVDLQQKLDAAVGNSSGRIG